MDCLKVTVADLGKLADYNGYDSASLFLKDLADAVGKVEVYQLDGSLYHTVTGQGR